MLGRMRIDDDSVWDRQRPKGKNQNSLRKPLKPNGKNAMGVSGKATSFHEVLPGLEPGLKSANYTRPLFVTLEAH
jgi:hypothetical protein